MGHFEKDAIISGLGISRIGRRTGIPGVELTLEAVRAAIDDAGLTPADIDGIATFGDTPVAEVVEALGIQATEIGYGFGTGGVLIPVMSACLAVSEKRARHVLVYRTVAMLGGSMNQEASPMLNPLASPPVRSDCWRCLLAHWAAFSRIASPGCVAWTRVPRCSSH